MTTAIAIRDVSKVFDTADGAVHAFGPARLDIEPGEFVSLLGPSGCGKSTLMLMVAGLLPTSSGEIRVDDEHVQAVICGSIARSFGNSSRV